MTESSSDRDRPGVRVDRRRFLGASAAAAAGLALKAPDVAAAATPLDVPGVVAKVAAPFAKNGFSGGLGGLFYTPLGGTLVGGLTADEGGAIEDGFAAGFYLPLFEANDGGASGKGYDAFVFLNGLLFTSSKQALAAGMAYLDLNKPKGVEIESEKLDNGAGYLSYDWSGHVPGFDAVANVHRGVAAAGPALVIIDWEDFTKAPAAGQIADLKASISAAIDASRTGIPLAEAVVRINSSEQVVFDVLKVEGVEINGQSSSEAENKALTAFAKHAVSFVRSAGALELLATGERFSVAVEELAFASGGGAKNFFAERRSLIGPIDAALDRSRVKGEAEAGIDGMDETTGDFYVQGRPDGSVLGGEVTVRAGTRVISMAMVNAAQTLPQGATVLDAGGDALAQVAALATSAIQALDIGAAGDRQYDAGFGRSVESGAL